MHVTFFKLKNRSEIIEEFLWNLKDYKLTIFIGENSDFLQTNHYPMLNWRDHKNIDDILKKDELLMEKTLHHIIKYRSVNRLKVN
jgi:hypothetical protein